MKKIIFILPLLLMVFVSCRDEYKISQLEHENNKLRYLICERDSLYEILDNEYKALKDKMTKHIKHVYTVHDEVIRYSDGSEEDIDDFVHWWLDGLSNAEIVGMFDITHDDVEEYRSSYVPYYKSKIRFIDDPPRSANLPDSVNKVARRVARRVATRFE